MSLESDVQAWIDGSALTELNQTSFAQVDIDELLDPTPVLAVAAMLDCIKVAATLCRIRNLKVTSMAVIPLPVIEDQEFPPTRHPALADLLLLDWVYGPGHEVPGLYLLGEGAQQLDAAVEEYRLALPKSASVQHAYYRAWRTLDERERSPGEWSRAVYVRSD